MEAGQLEQDQLQLLLPAKMTILQLHKELLVAHTRNWAVLSLSWSSGAQLTEHSWASPEPEGQALPWLQLPSFKCFYLDSTFGSLKLQQDVLGTALT